MWLVLHFYRTELLQAVCTDQHVSNFLSEAFIYDSWEISSAYFLSQLAGLQNKEPLSELSFLLPSFSFIFLNFIYLFIYLWLHWVFVAVRGFSLQWLLLLRSIGSRCVGFRSCGSQVSVAVACGL